MPIDNSNPPFEPLDCDAFINPRDWFMTDDNWKKNEIDCGDGIYFLRTLLHENTHVSNWMPSQCGPEGCHECMANLCSGTLTNWSDPENCPEWCTFDNYPPWHRDSSCRRPPW